MNQTIWIDLNSTLDTMLYDWLDWINGNFNTNYKTEDIDSWGKIMSLHGVEKEALGYFKSGYAYENIKIIPGADIFVKTLIAKYGIENIKILTHTLPGYGMEELKDSFVRECIHPEIEVVHQENKWKIMKEDDILIDDAFHNVYDAIKKANGYGIIYTKNQEYKYNDFIFDNMRYNREHDYGSVIRRVEEFIKL